MSSRRSRVRAPDWIVPLAGEARLSECEAAILAVLIERGFATIDELDAALRAAGSGAETIENVRVLVSKLRAKLAPLGWSIANDRLGVSSGWRLADAFRDAMNRRLAELEARSPRRLPAGWRMGGAQAVVTELLLSGRTVTRAEFRAALEAAGFTAEKALDVHVHRAKKKLAEVGIVVEAVYGVGYRVDDRSVARIAELAR